MICLKLGSWLASQKADKNVQLHCRSPHGERGLKYGILEIPTIQTCRSPHGERGLKYDSHGAAQDHRRSLSSWRAWIEIRPRPCRCRQLRSLSSWRAWIEIRRTIPSSNRPTSRSPHGERGLKSDDAACAALPWSVALLMESVD